MNILEQLKEQFGLTECEALKIIADMLYDFEFGVRPEDILFNEGLAITPENEAEIEGWI